MWSNKTSVDGALVRVVLFVLGRQRSLGRLRLLRQLRLRGRLPGERNGRSGGRRIRGDGRRVPLFASRRAARG